MEQKEPEVYRADPGGRRARAASASRGTARRWRKAYNHIILPLANRRDKRTQILWGLADFERRFGRKAEGMWLPETAVDLETLDLLAEAGVRFTILEPHQARRVRPKRGQGEETSGRTSAAGGSILRSPTR